MASNNKYEDPLIYSLHWEVSLIGRQSQCCFTCKTCFESECLQLCHIYYICDCVKIYCRYVFAVYTHIAFEGGTYCVWSQCKCAPNVVNYPTVRKEMTCWIASMIFAIPCNPKIWLHWTKRPRTETPGFVFIGKLLDERWIIPYFVAMDEILKKKHLI